MRRIIDFIRKWRSRLFLAVSLGCLLASSRRVLAQDSVFTYTNAPSPLAPSPFAFPTNVFGAPGFQPLNTTPGSIGPGQTASPLLGSSQLAGPGQPPLASFPAGPPLASLGPVKFYPNLDYRFTYGNGIEATPGVNSATAINTVTPQLLMLIGTIWSLTYSPTWSFYSSPLFKNTLDQAVTLQGLKSASDWTFGLSQTYSDTTDPLVETAAETEQVFYGTRIFADHQLGTKLSLQLEADQNFRLLPGSAGISLGYSDLHEWLTSDWLNYQLDPRLGLALGIQAGYDEVSIGSDMPFETYQGRITFRPSAKFSILLSGGIQDRQFIDPSAPSLLAPVFNIAASYQPITGTSMSLYASRTVAPSLYGDEVVTDTSVGASLRQKILKAFYCEVDGGYSDEPYNSIVAGTLPHAYFGVPPPTAPQTQVRDDTTESLRFSLGAILRHHFSASVFDMVSKNSSSAGEFSYTTHQGGFELDYRY